MWCWDGVTRLWCLCLVGTLVPSGRESSDLAVMRRARKILGGVACGCRGVVCVIAFRLRFLNAFLEGVWGRLMSFVLGLVF